LEFAKKRKFILELYKENPMNSQNLENTSDCPIAKVSSIVGDVWTILIVYHLIDGPKRFVELENLIKEISTSTLTDRLKKLTNLNLIQRKQYNQIPPKVVYSLTKNGENLKPVVQSLHQFANLYT
jgi:DNA-binding HxlR family transcriptional regulator